MFLVITTVDKNLHSVSKEIVFNLHKVFILVSQQKTTIKTFNRDNILEENDSSFPNLKNSKGPFQD